MAISRYRRGTSSPADSLTARRINDELAKLIGVPEARDYLDALALLGGIVEPEKADLDRALLAARSALRSVARFFLVEDAIPQLLGTAITKGTLDEAGAIALVIALAGVRGKRLMSRLDGRKPRELFVDEILWLFERSGLDISAFLRTDLESESERIRERFEVRVDSALAALDSDRRHALLGDVLDAYDDAARASIAVQARSAKATRVLATVLRGARKAHVR